jgi:hypothetical protein
LMSARQVTAVTAVARLQCQEAYICNVGRASPPAGAG